jgi:hypothetical protein
MDGSTDALAVTDRRINESQLTTVFILRPRMSASMCRVPLEAFVPEEDEPGKVNLLRMW